MATTASNLLLDLDDTLYDYEPAERAAMAATLEVVGADLGVAADAAQKLFVAARQAVKGRIDGRGSSHSRLLYLAELAHAAKRVDLLGGVRRWERTYWGAFIGAASLRPGAVALLEGWRAPGRRVAIVSDLTLEVQLWKLEAWGLLDHIDALVTSEEVPSNKPATEAFALAMQRLGGAAPESCVMVGDRDDRDGAGARALGIPYLQVRTTKTPGLTLAEVAQRLGLEP